MAKVVGVKFKDAGKLYYFSPAKIDVKMGDNPVVWVNEKVKARNVYFQMGHSPKLFKSDDFTAMLHNAISWTLGK